MQVKKNGMKLMKDTGSLTNALMENIGIKSPIKAGDTFAELMWTDRTLWVITSVKSEKEFYAKRVKTTMKNWTAGTTYPEYSEDGQIVTIGEEYHFKFSYKNWRYNYVKNPNSLYEKVHLSFGETTGYRDPSF